MAKPVPIEERLAELRTSVAFAIDALRQHNYGQAESYLRAADRNQRYFDSGGTRERMTLEESYGDNKRS